MQDSFALSTNLSNTVVSDRLLEDKNPGESFLLYSNWNHPDKGSPGHGPIGMRNYRQSPTGRDGNVCVALGNARITREIDKI